MPLPTYAEIQPYLEKGLISEQSHPENPAVRIFNYTQECQHSGAWDDVTRQCRGLILNVETGDVLANPFPKFFNWQEHLNNGWPFPSEAPIITDKYDGSLGILYFLNGLPWIATRGSFTSEQAQWATAWFRKNVWATGDESVNDNEVCHLFEIVYQENRIVVRYDFEGLVYLTSRFNGGSEGYGDVNMGCVFEGTPVRRARTVSPSSFEELAALDTPNSEGFVCHYPHANVRIKIKFPEYVRLHRILTGLSELGIWESLRAGTTLDLERIPDEFMAWVDEVQARLRAQYAEIENQAKEDYARAFNPELSRKENAFRFQKKPNPKILFSLLDGKDYSDTIWRMVRPHGARQFTTDTEG